MIKLILLIFETISKSLLCFGFSDELLKVQRLFIQAARLNPSSGVDPEVQSGLGILFTLGSDYDKAADCFRAAIGADPDVI